jgi:glutamine cyclotransferase
MKNKHLLLIAIVALFAACKNKSDNQKIAILMTPDAGLGVPDPAPVKTMVHYPASFSPDSVVYYLDSVRLESKPDSSPIYIKVDTLHMGLRTIMAKVWKDGEMHLGMTSFFKIPADMPERLTYNIINKFPHDTSADTHGLSYDNGFLYETAGDTAHAEIRKVELKTGKVLARQVLPGRHEAKGNTVVGDKVLMFLEKEHEGYLFDKNTLKPLGKFTRGAGATGWGATTDGKRIYFDDGRNRIWSIDKDTYKKTGYIDVFDHNDAVNLINELEYVDGKIYANVFGYDTIVIIDPKNGAVNQAINLMNLWPFKERPKKFDNEDNVINGIAYDAQGKRLFVTGRHWAWLFEIQAVKHLPTGIAAPEGVPHQQ